MMKKIFLLLSAMFAAVFLEAAEKGNLLYNPELNGAPFKASSPESWGMPGSVKLIPKGGPNGENILRLTNGKNTTIRQSELRLIEGEKYSFGGWVRTKNFKAKTAVFGYWAYGWVYAQYTATLPDTKGKWVRIEKTAVAPKSSKKLYEFGFYTPGWEGTIEIASPFIIPVSEKAKDAWKTVENQQPKFQEKIIQSVRTTKCTTAPVIDGNLNDAAWRNAFEFSDFVTLAKKNPAAAATRVKLLSDNSNIYIGVICTEPGKITDPGKTTGFDLWKGDLVELFFGAKSAARRMTQLAVGVNGCTYCGTGSPDAAILGGLNPAKQIGSWTAKVTKGEKQWCAEIKIPFAALGWQKHTAGDMIPFNFSRQRAAAKEIQTWSTRILRKFRETDHFGVLCLEDFKKAFEKQFRRKLSADTRAAFEKESARETLAGVKTRLNKMKKTVLVAPVHITGDFSEPYFPKEVLNPPSRISLRAAINELKPLALAVFNNTDTTQEYRIALEAGSSHYMSFVYPEGLIGFPKVTLRQGIRFRELPSGGRVLIDPLPRMNEARTITVSPRQAGLVWIDFDTAGVKPGKYSGRLMVIPLAGKGTFQKSTALENHYNGNISRIPVDLTVSDITLPVQPKQEFTLYSPTPLTASAMRLYEEMGCTSFNLSIWDFVFPKDKAGHLTASAPRAAEDILFHKKEAEAKGYRPKFPITYSVANFLPRVYGSKPELWREWFVNLAAFMKKMDVRKGEWWVEIQDEPWSKDLKKVTEFAKLAKEAVPDFPLAITTVAGRVKSPAEFEAIRPYISYWIFHRGDFSKNAAWTKFIQKVKNSGIPVGHYTCEVEIDSSLSENYRRTGWFTEYCNLDTHHLYQGFKNYNHQCGMDFKTTPEGTLLYASFDTAIPSIRSMAVRQGMTDIKYLAVLKSLAKKHPEAAAFLKTAAKRVVIDYPHDPLMPDKVREEAANLILKLKKQ